MKREKVYYYKALILHRMREFFDQDRGEELKEIFDATDKIPDVSDLASLEEMRNVAFIVGDRQRNLARENLDALNRIDSGEFGQCVNCGCLISEKRLAAYPTAKLCIRCKKHQEERQKSPVPYRINTILDVE